MSTGLSDDLISKCLTKSRYHPSDQLQDDGKCVICLVRISYMFPFVKDHTHAYCSSFCYIFLLLMIIFSLNSCILKSSSRSLSLSPLICVSIFLQEEYKNMEDIIGTLKCGHDFHVDCVRKWLSIKNLCPICKASATDDDNVKDKLST